MANKQVTRFFDSFPLYPEHLFSSIEFINMDSIERGVYLTLFIATWHQKAHQCYLKIDDEDICKLCKLSPQQWASMKQTILKKFKQTPDGYLYHDKLIAIYNDLIKGEKTEKKEQLNFRASVLNYTWEQFWNDYDKKVGSQERLIPKWLKLTDVEREQIRNHIPIYKASKPDKQYRRDPQTYLNNKTWLDEVILSKPHTQQKAQLNYDQQGDTAV